QASYGGLFLGCLSALAFNALNIIWPLSLEPLYVVQLHQTPWHASVLAGALICLVAVVFLVLSWRYSRKVFFAVAWVVLMYLPISNLYPLAYLMSDRYLYLVMPGVAMLFAIILDTFSLESSTGKIVATMAVLILVSCAWLTFKQNDVWQNDVTLYMQAVQVSPESADAQYMLGSSLLEAGSPGLAKVHLKKTLSLNPFFIEAYKSLAEAEQRLGNGAAAMDYYRKFIRYSQLQGGR
ncbi:MAG: hypothetical protein C0616_03625, partial [Desulfuromonas sp.]